MTAKNAKTILLASLFVAMLVSYSSLNIAGSAAGEIESQAKTLYSGEQKFIDR